MSFSKYHARRTTMDGIEFDSRAEANRYAELKLLEQAGEISNISVHPVYPLIVNGVNIGRYTGDFLYMDLHTNKEVLEDVKGVRVRDYVLRRKLVKAIYGIDILETGGRR